MPRSRRNIGRRLAAGLAPFALAVGVLPLLAPTCAGTGGVQSFSRGSIIIPMDMCYQYQTDGVSTASSVFSCPQAPDAGNVIRAYGLVYQLVRNNIAVYWVISPTKAALTDPDLTIQYDAGAPAFLYDWTTGGVSTTAPTSTNVITYRGGPFVVDGSDFDRASAVIRSYQNLYGAVNIHVSNVAFKGDVAKTMAGGWSAGGTVPPKLALLDIGSAGAGRKNSEVVIQGYLAQAGLDFNGAGGYATGTHGQIYDRLYMSDFQPDASGTAASSNLFRNGYQILWIPHWAAPTSCSDCLVGGSCSCTTFYTQPQIDAALKVIGAFSASGHDVFAECAGLGSLEGVAGDTTYRTGASDASTHLETTAGAGVPGLSRINTDGPGTAAFLGSFPSPFMQLGDFVFRPWSGAVTDYQSTLYRTETAHLISDTRASGSWDVFTMVPRAASQPGHGAVVYLGGHSYSGTDGYGFQIGGTRLVLNTLFNLGSGCVASGVSCNTGELGVCAVGTMQCDATTGLPKCVRTTGPSAEICDGLDNDCNGLVDDGLDTSCYDGPAASRNVGICHDGVRSCVRNADGSYGMSACAGQVLPGTEVCNGLDDDCNGLADDDPLSATHAALQQACYTGPSTSLDPSTGYPRGICKAGIQTCTNGVWDACPVCADAGSPWKAPASYPTCEILPHQEVCGETGQQYDMNCNGIVADGCGCTPSATQPCYRGPAGTLGNGACKAGTQTCQANGTWDNCSGDVLPGPLDCTKPPASPPADGNCNGIPDYQEPDCNKCPPAGDPALVCYDGPTGTANVGLCRSGTRTCAAGVLGATCNGEILPSPEVCDGKDNDCNGLVDDNATCPSGQTCVNGACVPGRCGVEVLCPEGYTCGAGGACEVGDCSPGVRCAQGAVCRYGVCFDPCAGVTCGTGTVCASGNCTAGGCYDTGCPQGQLCRAGACVRDACVGAPACPSGTFCRAGDCVQSCVFQTCAAGQRCDADGFCVTDACAAVTCQPNQLCVNGACVANPCLGVSCGTGLVCAGGACVDDPCSGVVCPVGVCVSGQCYPTASSGSGSDTTPTPPAAKSSKGCGCGSGPGSASSALLLLALLPLARRRRGAARPFRLGGIALLAAAVALGGTACKKSKKGFDPASCTSPQVTCGTEQRCVTLTSDPLHCGTCDTACGAAEQCVDAVCGPATAVAPYASAVAPTQAPRGAITHVTITGERFQTGAEVRVVAPDGTDVYAATVAGATQLGVDLDFRTSPTTSVTLRVLNPDGAGIPRVISNALTFDVITPTPHVDAVTPTVTATGLDLAVTGSGFIATSVCHVSGPGTADLALPTTVAASLTCPMATAGLSPGDWQLWVVNEGTLASNKVPFTVPGSGTAHLTAVTPSALAAGDVVDLLVTGTGFTAASVVRFDAVDQTTTYQDSGHVLGRSITIPACAGGAASCDFPITVSGADNSLVINVSASAPRVDTMSVTPSQLYQGDTVRLTFSGSNLTGATGGLVQPPVGAAATATLGAVTATSAEITVDLASGCSGPCPAGLYTAALVFPTGNSGSFQFRVLSNVAVLQSATPAGAPQGATLTVTLTGSNFRGTAATAQVLLTGDGQTRTYTPATWTTTGANGGTVALTLAPLFNTGVYALSVVNAGAAASNQLSFSVTPGPPAVTQITPSSTVSVSGAIPQLRTIEGTNFARPDANGNAASQVMISPDGTTWGTLPAGNTVTVVSSTQIDVSIDPRTTVPGSYLLQVWNPPGPQKSGSLAFTVTN